MNILFSLVEDLEEICGFTLLRKSENYGMALSKGIAEVQLVGSLESPVLKRLKIYSVSKKTLAAIYLSICRRVQDPGCQIMIRRDMHYRLISYLVDGTGHPDNCIKECIEILERFSALTPHLSLPCEVDSILKKVKELDTSYIKSSVFLHPARQNLLRRNLLDWLNTPAAFMYTWEPLELEEESNMVSLWKCSISIPMGRRVIFDLDALHTEEEIVAYRRSMGY